MSICKIGEKKEINGKWYRKQASIDQGFYGGCKGCSFNRGTCPLPATSEQVEMAIEDGGSECQNTVWIACPAPKPTSKPAPAKWTPILAGTKQAKAELIALANKLGAENARLKARLAKGGK